MVSGDGSQRRVSIFIRDLSRSSKEAVNVYARLQAGIAHSEAENLCGELLRRIDTYKESEGEARTKLNSILSDLDIPEVPLEKRFTSKQRFGEESGTNIVIWLVSEATRSDEFRSLIDSESVLENITRFMQLKLAKVHDRLYATYIKIFLALRPKSVAEKQRNARAASEDGTFFVSKSTDSVSVEKSTDNIKSSESVHDENPRRGVRFAAESDDENNSGEDDDDDSTNNSSILFNSDTAVASGRLSVEGITGSDEPLVLPEDARADIEHILLWDLLRPYLKLTYVLELCSKLVLDPEENASKTLLHEIEQRLGTPELLTWTEDVYNCLKMFEKVLVHHLHRTLKSALYEVERSMWVSGTSAEVHRAAARIIADKPVTRQSLLWEKKQTEDGETVRIKQLPDQRDFLKWTPSHATAKANRMRSGSMKDIDLEKLGSAVHRVISRLDESIEVEMVEEWLTWEQDVAKMRKKWNQADDGGFKMIKTKHERRIEQLELLRNMVQEADDDELPEKAIEMLEINVSRKFKRSKDQIDEMKESILEAIDNVESELNVGQNAKQRPGDFGSLRRKSFTATKVINLEREKIELGNADAVNFVLTNTSAEYRFLRLEVVHKLFQERIIKKEQLLNILERAYCDLVIAISEVSEEAEREGTELNIVDPNAEVHEDDGELHQHYTMHGDRHFEARALLLDSLFLLIGKRLKSFEHDTHRNLSERWRMLFTVSMSEKNVNALDDDDDEMGADGTGRPSLEAFTAANSADPNDARNILAPKLLQRFHDVYTGDFAASDVRAMADLFSSKKNSLLTSPNTASDLNIEELHSPSLMKLLEACNANPGSYAAFLVPHLMKGVLYYALMRRHMQFTNRENDEVRMVYISLLSTCRRVLAVRDAGVTPQERRSLRKAVMASHFVSSDLFTQENLERYLSVQPTKRNKGPKYMINSKFKYEPGKFKDREMHRVFTYEVDMIDMLFLDPADIHSVSLGRSGSQLSQMQLLSSKSFTRGKSAEVVDKTATPAKEATEGITDPEEVSEVFIALVEELVGTELFFRIFKERDDDVLNHYNEILVPALAASGIATDELTLHSAWLAYFVERVYPFMLERYSGTLDPQMQQEHLRELVKVGYDENGQPKKNLLRVVLKMVMYIIRIEFDNQLTLYLFQIRLFGLFVQSIASPRTYVKEQVTAGGGKSTVALYIKKFFVEYREDPFFSNLNGVLYVSNMPPEAFGTPMKTYLLQFRALAKGIKRAKFVDDLVISNCVGLDVSKVNEYVKDFSKTRAKDEDESVDLRFIFLDYVRDRARKDRGEMFRGGVHATFDELELISMDQDAKPILERLRFSTIVDESDYGPLPEFVAKYPKIGMSATTIWRESMNVIQYLYKSQMRRMGGRHSFPNLWITFRAVTKALDRLGQLMSGRMQICSADVRANIEKLEPELRDLITTLDSDAFMDKISAINKTYHGVSAAVVRKWSTELHGIILRHLREIVESIEILRGSLPGEQMELFLDGTTTWKDNVTHFWTRYFDHPENELKNVNSGLLMLPDTEPFPRRDDVEKFTTEKLLPLAPTGIKETITMLVQSKYEGKFKLVVNMETRKVEQTHLFNEMNENDPISGRVLCLYTVDSRGGDFKLNSNYQKVFVRAAVFEKRPGVVTIYQTLRRMRLLKPGMAPRQGPPLRTIVYLRERFVDVVVDSVHEQYSSEEEDFHTYVRRESTRTQMSVRSGAREIIKRLRTDAKYSKIPGAGYLKRSTKRDPVTRKLEETAFEKIFKNFSIQSTELFRRKVVRTADPAVSDFEKLWDTFWKKKQQSDVKQLWEDTVASEFRGKFMRTAATYDKFFRFVADEFRDNRNMQSRFFDLFFYTQFLPQTD